MRDKREASEQKRCQRGECAQSGVLFQDLLGHEHIFEHLCTFLQPTCDAVARTECGFVHCQVVRRRGWAGLITVLRHHVPTGDTHFAITVPMDWV